MNIDAGPEIGKVVLTASGVVASSAKPQALYGYAFKSGGTAGVISIFDGIGITSPSTIGWDDLGTINVTKVVPLGAGVVFPTGLYVSFDSNVTRVTCFVRQVIS